MRQKLIDLFLLISTCNSNYRNGVMRGMHEYVSTKIKQRNYRRLIRMERPQTTNLDQVRQMSNKGAQMVLHVYGNANGKLWKWRTQKMLQIEYTIGQRYPMCCNLQLQFIFRRLECLQLEMCCGMCSISDNWTQL